MNRNLYILKESVVKLVPLLGRKRIKVTQIGTRAYVSCNRKTKLPELVNIPALHEGASDELINAIQGFIDHEVGHILYSDFVALCKVSEDKRSVAMIANIFEDPFVERKMQEEFRGSKTNLENTQRFYLAKTLDETLAKADPADYAKILLVPAVRAVAGQPVMQEVMNDKWDLAPLLKKILTVDLAEQIRSVTSTKDNIALAYKFCELFDQYSETADTTFTEPDGVPTEGEDDVPDPKKGKEKKSKDRKEEKDDDFEDKDFEEKDLDDSEDEDSEDEDSGEGESDEGDSDEEDTDDKDSGEGEEEKSDDSGDEDADGDDKDSDGLDKGKDEDADGEESSESSDGSDSSSDDKGGEDTDSGAPKKPGASDEFSDVKDFDESLSEAISEMMRKEITSGTYWVPTLDQDRVEVYKPKRAESASHLLPSFIEDCDKVGHSVKKHFERMFKAADRVFWQKGQRKGKIASSSLHRLSAGDHRVFKQRQEIIASDCAVTLLFDASGSMRGGCKDQAAIQSAYIMSGALESIGIEHEVLGFTAIGHLSYPHEDVPRSVMPARDLALYMPILKQFSERLTPDVRARFPHYLNHGTWHENVDGECLRIAANRLVTRKAKRKILIVLSDGQPSCPGDRFAQSEDLLEAVKDVSKQVELLGIGVLTSAVSRYYPNHVVLNNINDLSGTLMKEMESIILKGAFK